MTDTVESPLGDVLASVIGGNADEIERLRSLTSLLNGQLEALDRSHADLSRKLAKAGRDAQLGQDLEAIIADRQQSPRARAIVGDMRQLNLGEEFDGILAWNSFFHLSQEDQRNMFPVFAAHAAPGAALMFTAGPSAGEVMGEAGGQPVYHASLSPEDYTGLLTSNGFELLRHTPDDPETHGHTIWLARYLGTEVELPKF